MAQWFAISTTRQVVYSVDCDATFMCLWGNGMLRFNNLEAGDFRSNAPKFQYVAGHDGCADFSRCESDEHVIHGPEAVDQSRSVSIHDSKQLPGSIKNGRCQAECAFSWKCLLKTVYGSLAFGRVCTEPKFKQNDGRDEPHDGSMTTQDPFYVFIGA